MCPYRYYTVMRNARDGKHLRLRMIHCAEDHGVKAAARLFHTTPKTVRKWRDRFDVTSFQEKPSIALAEAYFDSGDYFWNSGICFGRTDTFREEMRRHQPELAEGLRHDTRGRFARSRRQGCRWWGSERW